MIKNLDIFCCTECKIDQYDDITLENHHFVKQIRKQAFIRKAGGIGVFIKHCLFENVVQSA